MRTLLGPLLAVALLAGAPAMPAAAQAGKPAAAAPARGGKVFAPTPERKAAAEFAMVLALTRSLVSQQCQQVPQTSARAQSALAGWRARNQPLVKPLLEWTQYVVGTEAKNADEAKQAMQQVLVGYRAKAVALARIELGTDKPDAAACNASLARAENPAKDLEKSDHGPHLDAIRDFIEHATGPNAATH